MKSNHCSLSVIHYPLISSVVNVSFNFASGFSARLAGELGLPFAFAGHFSPEYILPEFELYRRKFEPSETLAKPYAMLAINVIAAETDEEAQFLATTQFQSFLRLIRGTPGEMQPPEIWTNCGQRRKKRRLNQNSAVR